MSVQKGTIDRRKPTRMWAVVTPRGKVVQVGRTRDEAVKGYLYSIEALGNQLVRVVVTVEAGKR